MNLDELKTKEKELIDRDMTLDQGVAKIAAEKVELDLELKEVQANIDRYNAEQQTQNELATLEKKREELSLKIEAIPEIKQLEELNKKIEDIKGA